MADLNIRNIDPVVISRLKREALEMGQTLRSRCIDLLGGSLVSQSPKPAVPVPSPSPEQIALRCPKHPQSPGWAKGGGWWCSACGKAWEVEDISSHS